MKEVVDLDTEFKKRLWKHEDDKDDGYGFGLLVFPL